MKITGKNPEPFVEVQHRKDGQLTHSTVRKLTAHERQIVDRARKRFLALERTRDEADKQMREMRERCMHLASFDVPGYIYDERYCYVCGISRGTV